jgi:two-component system cell cycle sensor histidine kinase/response regulator CckA
MPAPVPPDEGARLEALRRYGVLDTPREAEFDDLATVAGCLCQTPIALITLVDEDRQFFKAAIGLDRRETPRDQAFCAYTILTDAPFIVEHASEDPRFTDNPLVVGEPYIRFYAGAPLISPEGHRLGSLCVIDHERRQLTEQQAHALQILARAVVTQLELRRTVLGLNQTIADLQFQRQLLDTAERLAGIGSWQMDLSTGRLRGSRETQRIFDLSPTDPEPDRDLMLSRLHPDDVAMVQEGFRAAPPGEPIRLEYRLRLPHGETRYVQTRAEITRGPHGEPSRIWGATLDVTPQREAAEALRESEQRYRLLFEGNPQPMWVFDDDTLAFLAVNDAALQQYGYTREEFLSLTLRDIRPPEDVARMEAYRRERPDARIRAGQWRHQRKDGTRIDVEVTSHAIAWHHHRARLTLATDITERLTAERAVRASQERLTLVLEGAGLGFWDWEIPAGRIVLSERLAAILGYPLDELSPLPASDWGTRIHPDDHGPVTDLWTKHLQGATTSLDLEYRMRTKAGEWRWVQIRGRIVERDSAGAPTRALGTLLDIGERKKLEAHFLRAQRMESIGTLAGGIAHDLNNVLTPILMGTDLLRAQTSDPQVVGTIAMIEESATRGADMVRQVLSFARGYEGTRGTVEPGQPLQDVARIARETFPKNITVDSAWSEDLWTVAADPTQLHQVLLNLCVNARDAMLSGGTLRLSAENIALDESYAGMTSDARAGRYVVLTVTDSGAGIPGAIKDRIFDPFFTTKEPGSGTGLGLSTALAIVRSHGGFINVYSEAGRGATFRVYLPASDGAVGEGTPSAAVPVPRGRGELVLVVDDEAPIRAVCRRTLEAFGYRVIAASDGAEGVALYAEHRRDIAVVLLDMMMPIMDGPATARAMLRMNPNVRIVGASGLADSALSTKALSAGVRQLLAKPYSAETLLQTIARVRDEPDIASD